MKTIKYEEIKNAKKYENVELSKEEVKKAIDYILKKTDKNMDIFRDKFPNAMADENAVYEAIDNTQWTASFWTGIVWLAYDVTGDEKYKELAHHQLANFEKRLDDWVEIDHDLGFLYSLSAVAEYKRTKNPDAKKLALRAADELVLRFKRKGQFILAWGEMDDLNPPKGNRMIIDCMMNLPLLYWAYNETGVQKYYDVAKKHAEQCMEYIVRDDASSFHTFFFDKETGNPSHGETRQGFAHDSCWARGQSWGIYGFALSAFYTHDEKFIETSEKMANYFINKLCDDDICLWDFACTKERTYRDTSAAAITACGLLELCKMLPLTNKNRAIYENCAKAIIKSLIENYTTENIPNANAILLHGTASVNAVDIPLIYGDYYFFEALVRLHQSWNMYW